MRWFVLVGWLSVAASAACSRGQSPTTVATPSHAQGTGSVSSSPDDQGLASIPPADNPNVYTNEVVGFAVTKPTQWIFAPIEAHLQNAPSVITDEDFAQAVQRYATRPLVVMAAPSLSGERMAPSFKVIFRPLGTLADRTPTEILAVISAPLPKNLRDFEVLEAASSTEISGLPAASMTYGFTLLTETDHAIPVLSKLWIVKRGAYVFMLGGSGRRDEREEWTDEFDGILQSVVIDPLSG